MIEVAGYGPFPHQLSGMHDNSGMSASQLARMSPGSSMRSMQPLPHEIQHTSVIKKIDHSVESFIPSSKANGNMADVSAVDRSGFDQRVGSDNFADDDFSDHDSHYSEDFEDDIDMEFQEQNEPDITRQLLDFATMVSTDIQKYFGRKKGDDDSCDIYEDKWVSTKSGRELYYADLMKIVHGEDKVGKDGSSPLLDISNSVSSENKDNRNMFTGKADKKIGIGPLNELFEYGLRHFLSDKKLKHSKELKRLKSDVKRFDNVTPMHNRKLPNSFFREPGVQQTNSDTRTNTGSSVLQTNNPPDFSDLLESWRLDRNEFSGDMSSSEVSMSPESA